MTSITIKSVDVKDPKIQIGIESIMYDHYDEVTPHGNPTVLAPNWLAYGLIQDQGNLIIMGAFDGEILVGYVLVMLIHPLHYKNDIAAVVDTIFVSKEYRSTRAGLVFIKEAEKEAKKRGACVIHWSAKPGSNLEKLYKKKGYSVRDIVFSKVL